MTQIEPIQPERAPAPTETESLIAPYQPDRILSTGGVGVGSESLIADEDRREYAQALQSAGASVSNAASLNYVAKPDLGEALSQTDVALQVQRRTPITMAPYIRGFKNAQIYGQVDGQYFLPVRQDLDTILSKVDPGTIQDVIVIPGPYSVQYGPGFTFIDMVTAATPRCQRAQFRSNAFYNANGQQWYGRQTVTGGGSNYGYRLSYGHRNGNDYYTGGGNTPRGGPFGMEASKVPSHYNQGDILADYGYDLTPNHHVDVNYRRLDQNHTAFPGEIFDINALTTNALNLRYIDEDPTKPWTRWTTQGWVNNTFFDGNNQNPTKQPVNEQIATAVANQTNAAIGFPLTTPGGTVFTATTSGNLTNSGGRSMALFGDLNETSLTTGIDARSLNQSLRENFSISPVPNATNTGLDLAPIPFHTGLPDSSLVNPGAFAEMTLRPTDWWRVKFGGRGDYVYTHANAGQLTGLSGSLAVPANGQLQSSTGLYAFYLSNQVQLNRYWTGNFAIGQAQRPPSLIDRYADGMFLGILQNGFSRVIGNPNLANERNWQIDASLNGNYERWRGFVRGYQSWVLDYITYSAASVNALPAIPPSLTGARLLNTLNTPLATLSGCEMYTDYDYNPWVTPYARLNYVYGVDQTIHQALPTIPPLQSYLGIRFHDNQGGRLWGFETFARVVARQDRNGVIRQTGNDNSPPFYVAEYRTAGFTTAHIRGYWNVNNNLQLMAGVDNLFNRFYIEHLSLHTGTAQTWVWSPGISPYVNVQWIY